MFKMNTKIQILNSIDLEKISGGMNQDNFLGGLTTPFGFQMKECKSDSEVFKELKGKGFIEGLKSLYGNGFSEAYLGDFSGIFSGEKISERAGALTAFGIVCATVTGTVIGAYKGIKWVAKKIF